MTDEREQDGLTPTEEEAQQRSLDSTPPPPPDPADVPTVSLLDLMDDADTLTVSEQPRGDGTPPPLMSSPTVDAPTVTEDLSPTLTEVPESTTNEHDDEPPPSPPSILEPPAERPLERDQDATAVRPHVAFPGGRPTTRTMPATEAPTKVHQRPVRPPSDPARPTPDKPDVPVGSPKREAPTQRQPTIRPPRRESPSDPRGLPIGSPVRETPAGRGQPTIPTQPNRPTPPEPVLIDTSQKQPKRQPKPRRRRDWRGCMTRVIAIGLVLLVGGFAMGVAGSAIAYGAIANDLPSPRELEGRASTFETARIFDRNGDLLYALADPNTGNRTRVSLAQISPYVVSATIATEDSRFYENPGFDPIGIARAVVQAAREREFVSGASTITQQLVRAVLLDEDERTERSFRRKVREIILAAEIARTYEKDTILELYLNEIYYGNLAYGIEAAAQTYFDKPAAELTLTEASLLAGLPQAPALWDPYTAPEKAAGRQWEVLTLMLDEGYVTFEEAQNALNEASLFLYDMTPPERTIRHPHFSITVLQQAETALGSQSIYRGGLRIHTTLDPQVQKIAEDTLTLFRPQIVNGGANNGAIVVVRPQSGEILALVGSVDFNDEAISGQVNMALQPRQPGSTIKPFVYLSAMQRGWTPATLIWDVPTEFPDGTNPPYVPKNYDDEFHGPLRLRPSLGNSYNVTAVKALEFVGVCDFIRDVQKLGLTSLLDEGCNEVNQPRNYGLALSLGGGEISPLEMATAFSVLANQGQRETPFAIRRIENNRGELLFEQMPPILEESQVVQAEHAYLLSDILSDNGARQPEFGQNNPLVIANHRVAAKTGTSGTTRFDVRDAWTIGYTPEVVTAVWVGNTDNSPIGEGQSGTRLAAPIWNSFMSQYLSTRAPVDFVVPTGIVSAEICADSGTRPSSACQNRMQERFVASQLPLDSDNDFLQKVPIDLWTNQRATESCPDAVYEANFFNLLVVGHNEAIEARERALAQAWLTQSAAGRQWASQRNLDPSLGRPPEQACNDNTPRPRIIINQPTAGSEIIDTIEIRGSVNAPNYGGYVVEYGLSHDPGGWGRIQDLRSETIENGLLAEWDTSDIRSGPITIRVLVVGPDNPYTAENDPVVAEERVTLTLLEPTPTATPTPTDTPTPTNTPTPTPTNLPTDTPTPTATTAVSTNTPIPSPSDTPTVEANITPIIDITPIIRQTAEPTPSE